MAEYISDYGVERILGVGSGTETYNRSDTPAEFGPFQSITVSFDYAKDGRLPTFNINEEFGRGICGIPAGMIIKEAYLVVRSIEGGTATFGIGLYQKDGTVIAADGIAASAEYSEAKGYKLEAGTSLDVQMEDKAFIMFNNPTVTATDFSGYLTVVFA